jgi:hypothetical protein
MKPFPEGPLSTLGHEVVFAYSIRQNLFYMGDAISENCGA